jgi:serine/threonine protein kinase
MTEQCGTPAYIAPEILRDEGYYGFAVDRWSSGVVLYAMLYGTVPFKANNMQELQQIIKKLKSCASKMDYSQYPRHRSSLILKLPQMLLGSFRRDANGA